MRSGQITVSRSLAYGFTLIEVLVVVMVIGLISSLAVLSLSFSTDDSAIEEGRRLQTVIRYGLDEAVLTGKTIALQLSEDGYRFFGHEGAEWKTMEQKALLPHQLKKGVSMSFDQSTDSSELNAVLLFPMGEVSEIKVEFVSETDRVTLSLSATGETTLSSESER